MGAPKPMKAIGLPRTLLLVAMPLFLVESLLLVVRPGAPVASLLLVGDRPAGGRGHCSILPRQRWRHSNPAGSNQTLKKNIKPFSM